MKPNGCQIVFQSKTAAKVKFPDKRKDFDFFFTCCSQINAYGAPKWSFPYAIFEFRLQNSPSQTFYAHFL